MNGYTKDVVAGVPIRLKTPPLTSRSIREQEEQTTALRNENFRLKLRIYFMEQQKKSTTGDCPSSHLADSTHTTTASTMSTMSGGDDLAADRLGRENISLRVDLELLRSELFDKQSLLCEAAAGMEQMNEILQTERLQHGTSIDQMQTKMDAMHAEISDLMGRVSNSSSCNEQTTDLAEIQEQFYSQREQLDRMAMKQANDEQLLIEMDRRFDELQAAYRRALLELDGLKEELASKTLINNELEMFRAYSRKHFTQQVERLCRENRTLREELTGIKSKIRSFDLNETSLDENLRIIADQSRLMRELHKTIDSKKKSMSSMRSELDTNEREMRFLRQQNTELLERIQTTPCSRCRLRAPSSLESLPTAYASSSASSARQPQSHIWPLESRVCASATSRPMVTLMPGLTAVRSATIIHSNHSMATTLQMNTVCCRLAALPSPHSARLSTTLAMGAGATRAQIAPAQLKRTTDGVEGISLGEEIDLIGKKSLVHKGLRLLFDRMKN